MAELAQFVWLYRRASDSVLLIREESSVCRLLVYWQGIDAVSSEFPSVADCMKPQTEIEQDLVVAGFHLTHSFPP